MRFIIFSILIIISIVGAKAQNFSGTYVDGRDTLIFEGDSVWFNMEGDDCLTAFNIGYGHFKVLDRFLLIHIGKVPERKVFEFMPFKMDSALFKITDHKTREPIASANLVLKDDEGNLVKGGASDNDGRGALYPIKGRNASRVEISFLGYGMIRFPYMGTGYYKAEMRESSFIENETLAYVIEEQREGQFIIRLLERDFKPKRPEKKLKYLNRLLKKSVGCNSKHRHYTRLNP